jgi:membrane protein DedA with SNARE-associated domain
MTQLLDRLLTVHGPLVYGIVGLLVFAEDALFVGFVVPGETAAVLGGVVASRGGASLWLMVVVVVLAAVVGDTVGYEVGRHLGTRLLRTRFLARRQPRLEQAQEMLRRRGGAAVFLGRFVAFFRAVMPALAGTSGMPYPRFVTFNAAGGLTWGTAFVLLGFLAGNSYQRIEKVVGRGAALAVAAVVILAVVVWRVRAHRRELSAQRRGTGTRD